ncbi:virB8 family protein [Parasphingorhabdus sp.]|uniref:virB8 family protein n=1 Tax=Parasphingorhabdus sp. TaxID=2709688 RepID=UPI003BB18529
MKKDIREKVDKYYKEAETWSSDRNRSLVNSRKWALVIAAILAFVAIAQAIALIILIPLKTVEPYTLLVDKQTGYVEELRPLQNATIKPDEALTRSFLVQYVLAREGFDIDTLQRDYRKVYLWSTGKVRTGYVSSVQAGNPSSPLARLPRQTRLDVEVRSVSMLSDSTAMVRYNLTRLDQSGQARDLGARVSVLRWTYSGGPMTVEDRLINPLGFQVTRYSSDVETLPVRDETGAQTAIEEDAIEEDNAPPPDPRAARERRLRSGNAKSAEPVQAP